MNCQNHGVPDLRGPHADVLSVPECKAGSHYAVWDDETGDSSYVVFYCSLSAANWASEVLDDLEDDDPQVVLKIKEACSKHWEQPADNCEDCDETKETS